MSSGIDLLHHLPGIEVMFDQLPAAAVVLEALVPAVGDGLIVFDGADKHLAVLCRAGAMAGRFPVPAGASVDHLPQDPATTVTAWRLSPAALGVVPTLLGGARRLADVSMRWIEMTQLLDDLRSSGTESVVVISTEHASGLTHIAGGQHLLTVCSQVHGPCDASSLVELAGGGEGTINLLETRRDSPQLGSSQLDVVSHTDANGVVDMLGRSETQAHDEAMLPATARLTDATFHPFPAQETMAAIFGDAVEPQRPTAHREAAPKITHLLPQLRLIARSQLGLSATRVEDLLEEAAATVDGAHTALTAIASLPIRGVSASTMERLAEKLRDACEAGNVI